MKWLLGLGEKKLRDHVEKSVVVFSGLHLPIAQQELGNTPLPLPTRLDSTRC